MRSLGIVLVVGLLAVGGYLYGDRGLALIGLAENETAAPRGRPNFPVPVNAVAAVTQTVPVTIDTIGSIQAFATVSVKSRVEGQVMQAFFSDGQRVKKGDPLFAVDKRPFETKVNELEANLARDRAQLVAAKADLKRYTDLSKTGYSSQQKFDQARAAAEGLAAGVKADTAALERAKLDLEFTAINAPIDGVTGSVLINPGNLVKANDGNPLVIINQTQPIYASFSVPEQHLPEIKARMAEGGLPVEVRVPGSTMAPDRGKVAFVNNAVDTATGTIQLKAELPNKQDLLTPGQYVRVTLTLRVIPNAVVVPQQAVQNGQVGTFVYVIRPDHSVAVRPISLGPTHDQMVVVERGLSAGDEVVTDGQLRLRPGSKVIIQAADGAPRGPPGGGKRHGRGRPGGPGAPAAKERPAS